MRPSKNTILIVEDDSDIREILKELLEWEGHSVVAAGNGEAALAYLRTASAPPSLIILDVMMPVLDGPGFLGQLDAASKGRIPVLVLSACKSLPHTMRERVDGFLRKPIDNEGLLSAITPYFSPRA